MIAVGDHVRVIAGRYRNETGFVVRVEHNMVVLFSDLSMNELKVLPRYLQLYCDMATGDDSKGQFQWADMVQLDAQSVGVIVRLVKMKKLSGEDNAIVFFPFIFLIRFN